MVPGGGAGSIQGAAACERDVLLTEGVDHGRVVHAFDAFVAGEHERIAGGVAAEHERGARVEVQVHVALEVDGAGHVGPGGHHDVAAACGVAGRDRLLESGRVVGVTVAHGTVGRMRDDEARVREDWHHGVGQDAVGL